MNNAREEVNSKIRQFGDFSPKKKILFAVLGIFLVLCIVEVGLHIAQAIFQFPYLQVERQWQLAERSSLHLYRDKPWAKAYYNELGSMSSTIDPFVGWIPNDIHGTYINVTDGMRKTWNPPGGRKSIFMFGGSALLGIGARDDYTIPSDVSRMLGTYSVSNYGQSGYVLVQEIAKLVTLLREGKRPNYVIFYDGANDVSYAYESGIPNGAPKIIKDEFQGKMGSDRAVLGNIAKNFIKDNCFLCRIAVGGIRLFIPKFLNPNVVVGQGYTNAQLRELAQGVADQYRHDTIPFLEQLSRTFGFKLIMIWQPTIYTEQKLIGEEALLGTIDPHITDVNARKVYQEINALLESDPAHDFYNLTDALKDRTGEYYIDYVHISEDGNDAVAQRIVKILQPYLTR